MIEQIDHGNQTSITMIPPVTAYFPLQGRKYTATYSDITGDIYVSVGNRFTINPTNINSYDCLKAEWKTYLGEYALSCTIDLHCEEHEKTLARVKYLIYKKELPNLLAVMLESDKPFLHYYPLLLDAPIKVEMTSNFPEFRQILYMGTPRHYLK
ncbi:staygreen family protein [Heyndrickxia ginsengihumi]|uniref:Staygreen protein domain-containing protein n=1 Tax=Heyndrickxia ginsengihumi TaxID=363870 RepID=A0A6M0PAR7_9BACI|nr:staygreen family protein [Heyndrickxia ginsengihumi]MBE6183358.1 hypothetical protein [Bacillus sp. (in: firmicutes)]MCM3024079.1 staygreen family protein [Heyndrickxia ginsengihumi]NEY21079.1 hypothetical protein [Heyndrickxia ginsengihumi]